jgi:hypothetical protein
MEKALAFQILEQDESWRYEEEEEYCFSDKKCLDFKTSNGIIIESIEFPSMEDIENKSILQIRGENINYDETISAKFFDSTKQRDKYYNKINQALKEWDLMVENLNKEKK